MGESSREPCECKLDYNENFIKSAMKIKGIGAIGGRMSAGKGNLLFLWATAIATLYLLYPSSSTLLLWGVMTALGASRAVVKRSSSGRTLVLLSYLSFAAGLAVSGSALYRSSRAERGWESLRLEVVRELGLELNEALADRLEGRVNLVRAIGDEIWAFRSPSGSPNDARERLFALLEERRLGEPSAGDLFLLFTALDGTEIAWSGDRYLPLRVELSPVAVADSLSMGLYRGNIVSAAVLVYRIPGLGILNLHDHLEIRNHLSRRYSRSGRFIDRLSGGLGSDVSIHPVDEQRRRGSQPDAAWIPFLFHGATLGHWAVDAITLSGYIARLRSFEDRVLPLLLFLPWIASFLIVKEWLRVSFLMRGRWPAVRRSLYVVLLGLFLIALRVVWLEISFPSSWIGGEIFSPRYFASGLLEGGSVSVGEFFISGLLISLFALHLLFLLAMREQAGSPQPAWSLRRGIAGLVIGVSLACYAPFVMERLLRDSLFSLVIDQDFIRSPVTILWELGLFLLLLPLLLGISLALQPLSFHVSRKPRSVWGLSLLGALLFSLAILLASNPAGESLNMAFAVIEGAMILAAGALTAAMAVVGKDGERGRVASPIRFPLLIVLPLLSAGILYPALLRYRHLILEETGRELLEQIGAPYDNRAAFLLERVADEMSDRVEEVISSSGDPQGLGYYAWANSSLSAIGQKSSLAIFDARGDPVSAFSLAEFEPDSALMDFFTDRARQASDPFIYHGFSRGREFYTVIVPCWEGGGLKRFIAVTLPTDLEERLEREPVRFFLDEPEEDALHLPEAMTVKVLGAGEEYPDDGNWVTDRDEDGRFRHYRKRVKVGAREKGVEIAFRLQGPGESLSRVNFLFLLHLALMAVLGLVFLEKPPATGWIWAATFQRKLTITLFIFSMIPTILLAVVSAGEIRHRLDTETRSRARDTLEAVLHSIGRDVGRAHDGGDTGTIAFAPAAGGIYARPAGTGDEEGILLDNRYIQGLARTVGRDLLLFSGSRLMSTSQEHLAQAGMIPGIVGGGSYVDLILKGKEYAFDRKSLGDYPYMVASKRLSPTGADTPIILSTPLLWRQEEVDREVSDLSYFVLMIIVGIIFLSSVMGITVGSLLSRPISQLREAFERVGSGDFRVSLERERKDEFGHLFSSFREMSKQLETSQRRLSEEKARIDGILQAVGAGIMAFGSDGTLRLVNARAVSLIGGELPGQIGRGIEELSFRNDGWRAMVRTVRDLLVSKGSGCESEFTVMAGDESLTVRLVANRLIDEHGESQGVVVAFEDISESIRSQKIMAWGEMARQVAHEIKNPLTPIRLSIQHLYRTFRDGASDFPRIIEEEVQVILREIDRLRRIAGDFSRYAKPEEEAPHRVEITAVVREVMDLYAKEHGRIHHRCVFPESGVWAMATEEGLKKVLVNLIENGREAIEGPGSLEVAVERETGPAEGRVRITVSDTGRGIRKEDLARIFDPNFSTRSGGTGLGLAICKRIVEGWGGEIEITSRPGAGTRVGVRILAAGGNP